MKSQKKKPYNSPVVYTLKLEPCNDPALEEECAKKVLEWLTRGIDGAKAQGR